MEGKGTLEEVLQWLKEKTKSPTEVRNETFLPLAKQLAEIISSHKNITIPPAKFKLWTNDFRLLAEIEKVDMRRQRNALRGYAKVIGEKYAQQIYSGDAFRRKLIKLEDYIEKDQKPQPSKQGQIANGHYQHIDYKTPEIHDHSKL